MKIGMFTSGYQRNPIEDIFADAREYGYDYIELWGGRPHAYAPDLKRNGYKKTATQELVTNYINEPRFYAKRAIDNMRSLMQQAGMH